ncbi:hypothetical protein NKL07_06715 [Mesorhizobium sp. C280B]|uniref:hypothetical protein n=1 Tax=unclassified Mesorhizobium TaxID=325217 RepID=UPI0018DD7CEC|nr:hypothetical protein [Mesorhizobium sp. LSJC280B00]
MAAGKIPEKTRQDDTCKSWIDADGEAAGLELRNVVRQAANPRHTLDDLANLLVEQHRFCGWDQATRTPYEQLNLQRVFKVGDVRADRWLGDMQMLTCAGHGSRLHHSPERLKLLVVLRRNLPPKAQWEAATALGFRFTRTLRLVIVPQAVRLMLPPTVGFMVQIVKTRADRADRACRRRHTGQHRDFQPVVAFGTVSIIYFALCWPLSLYAGYLDTQSRDTAGHAGCLAKAGQPLNAGKVRPLTPTSSANSPPGFFWRTK